MLYLKQGIFITVSQQL